MPRKYRSFFIQRKGYSATKRKETRLEKSDRLWNRISVFFSFFGVLASVYLGCKANEIGNQSLKVSQRVEKDRSLIDTVTKLVVKQDSLIDKISQEINILNKQNQNSEIQTGYMNKSDREREQSARNIFRRNISDLELFLSKYNATREALMYDHYSSLEIEIIKGMPNLPRIAYYKELSTILREHINNEIVLSDSNLFEIWNNFANYLNHYVDSANNPHPRNPFHINPYNNPLPRREDRGTTMSYPEAQEFMNKRNVVYSATFDKVKLLKKSEFFLKR